MCNELSPPALLWIPKKGETYCLRQDFNQTAPRLPVLLEVEGETLSQDKRSGELLLALRVLDAGKSPAYTDRETIVMSLNKLSNRYALLPPSNKP